ncbi:MAG: hypothetical protein M0R69_00510 [Candidatus Cloacimonetes bacterium]|jgi:hypothetical protein|nr:hypothetical protein [Candidatus Cloacimonadota bacterium]
MKKFILPLMLLLLAAGFLFAVESDPSAVVGYVKYDCLAGNNMIALPMQTDFAFASETGDAIGATSVGFWDAAIQAWTFIDKLPWGVWTAEFPVTSGDPLWISVDADLDFYSIGDLPATMPSYDLVAGNNTIMLPLNKSELSLASIAGDDIGASSVGFWDSSIQAWTFIDKLPWGVWTEEFDTAIGAPLWISTDNAGTWPSRARSNNGNVKSNIGAKK